MNNSITLVLAMFLALSNLRVSAQQPGGGAQPFNPFVDQGNCVFSVTGAAASFSPTLNKNYLQIANTADCYLDYAQTDILQVPLTLERKLHLKATIYTLTGVAPPLTTIVYTAFINTYYGSAPATTTGGITTGGTTTGGTTNINWPTNWSLIIGKDPNDMSTLAITATTATLTIEQVNNTATAIPVNNNFFNTPLVPNSLYKVTLTITTPPGTPGTFKKGNKRHKYITGPGPLTMQTYDYMLNLFVSAHY